MDDIEDLLEAFRIVSASLEKLRQIDGPDMLLPGKVEYYHSILEDAYAAYGRVETVVDELGQQLEDEHRPLDEGVRQYGQPDKAP
jgi:hypothetical protein